jgi:F1F0 ATPase subunit 2
MKSTDAIFYGLSLLWGVALGFFYFGGLWWTLRSLPGKARPKQWLTGSYVLRVLTILPGFWVVLREDLVAFFLTFMAFMCVRFVLTRHLSLRVKGGGCAN